MSKREITLDDIFKYARKEDLAQLAIQVGNLLNQSVFEEEVTLETNRMYRGYAMACFDIAEELEPYCSRVLDRVAEALEKGEEALDKEGNLLKVGDKIVHQDWPNHEYTVKAIERYTSDTRGFWIDTGGGGSHSTAYTKVFEKEEVEVNDIILENIALIACLRDIRQRCHDRRRWTADNAPPAWPDILSRIEEVEDCL